MRSIPIAAKAGGFKLQQRAVHVFAEAQRVRDFQTVCNNRELSQDSKLQQLGDIMDASQASCRSECPLTLAQRSWAALILHLTHMESWLHTAVQCCFW